MFVSNTAVLEVLLLTKFVVIRRDVNFAKILRCLKLHRFISSSSSHEQDGLQTFSV